MGGLASDCFEQGEHAIAACITHAQLRTLERQSHVADPETLAAELERFFGERGGWR